MENKKSLSDDFFTLDSQQRRLVHLALCENALEKWNFYVNTHDRVQYTESVVGTRQEVDKRLPFDSLKAAKQGVDSQNIAKKYMEPIAALQDGDLTFPENITFAYYAIYNLFNKYAQNKVIDDWLIVNQALSSEEDSEAWNALLDKAIQMIKK